MGAHEKSGGRAPNRSSCRDFQQMIDTCSLSCIDTRGSWYTWSNCRGGLDRIELRLDRFLGSSGFFSNWNSIDCLALPRHSSDHNPLLIQCSLAASGSYRPFRFKEMWTQHPNFLAYVSDCWT